MNSVFLAVSDAERENILSQHREVYNGYQTLNPNPVDNIQPLYVQDFANDKEGLVVNNKGEVKAYTNVGINESRSDFSPLSYAKKVMNGEMEIEDAIIESGIPFILLNNLIKKLRGKGIDMREEEMCEQCGEEMSEQDDSMMDLSLLGDRIMGSQEFQQLFNEVDPAEFNDEFEYADNMFYWATKDYEDEPFYDDLIEYLKDMYSDSFFDAYAVTMGDSFFNDEEDAEDIDFEEIDEIYADDMDVSDEEAAYDFKSDGPVDVYGTMQDYDKATDSYHPINSMKDVERYDDS